MESRSSGFDDEFEARGIVFAIARRKHAVRRLFEASWVDVRRELADEHSYPTLISAVDTYHARMRGAPGGQVPGVAAVSPGT